MPHQTICKYMILVVILQQFNGFYMNILSEQLFRGLYGYW